MPRQSRWQKRNKPSGLTLPDIKTYYKAIVIRLCSYWHKDKKIDKCNKIESPETSIYVWSSDIRKQ